MSPMRFQEALIEPFVIKAPNKSLVAFRKLFNRKLFKYSLHGRLINFANIFWESSKHILCYFYFIISLCFRIMFHIIFTWLRDKFIVMKLGMFSFIYFLTLFYPLKPSHFCLFPLICPITSWCSYFIYSIWFDSLKKHMWKRAIIRNFPFIFFTLPTQISWLIF